VRNPVAGPDRRLRRRSAGVACPPRASRPLTAAERSWLLAQMGRGVSDPGATALPAVEPKGGLEMIGRPSAQAAVVPLARSQATGRALVQSAAPAAVPPAGVPAAAPLAAAIVPAAAAVRATRSAGEPRASPLRTAAKYRTVFACASHAQDTSTEEQRS